MTPEEEAAYKKTWAYALEQRDQAVEQLQVSLVEAFKPLLLQMNRLAQRLGF